MEIKYSESGDVMYIKFNNHAVERTRRINDFINVDLAADDSVIGIELFAVSKYADRLDQIIALYSRRDQTA